jgi:predicted aspartyl protease
MAGSVPRLAVIAAAACALVTASPAASAPPPVAFVISGIRTEGDAPARMTKILDLRTGFSRMSFQMGDHETQSGFDGMDWVAPNGITNSIDLPALVAEARARAWVDRSGWRQTGAGGSHRRVMPPGASPLTLYFGSNRRVDHIVVEGDYGPLTIKLGDWRRVGAVTYPFRQDMLDAAGERTIIQAETVESRLKLGPQALDRPAPVRHGELAGAVPATVPMELMNGRHISVQAKINGAPANLIFDTGAANYLTTDAAPKFAVRTTGGINLAGVGEMSTVGGYATIDRIALGEASLRDETIVVGPSPFPKVDGKPSTTDGFTGFEFFAEFITTIDYPGGSLVFASPGSGTRPAGIPVRFYSDGHGMFIPATIEGHTGLFGLDTGAGSLTIFPDYARKFGLRGDAPVATSSGGIGGAVKAQPGKLRNFSLGGLSFAQLPVKFSQNRTGAFASRTLAGNIGAVVLQCYRLTIDYSGRTVWFDPAPVLPGCGGGAKVFTAKR